MIVRALIAVLVFFFVSVAQAADGTRAQKTQEEKSAEFERGIQGAYQKHLRMSWASKGNKWCLALVNRVTTLEVAYYTIAHTNGLFAAFPYVRGVVDIRDILDRDCPGVWGAQACPMGDCGPALSPRQVEEFKDILKKR